MKSNEGPNETNNSLEGASRREKEINGLGSMDVANGRGNGELTAPITTQVSAFVNEEVPTPRQVENMEENGVLSRSTSEDGGT